MKISVPKLKAIVRYFCTNTNPRFLGKIKLMKLFYFLDFRHVKKHGVPVTYDKYFNLEHGPIPSLIKNLIDDLDDDPTNSVLNDEISVEHADKKHIHRIVCKHPFTDDDKRLFTNSELAVLESVSKEFASMTTQAVETVSHGESPWKLTKLLQEISYSLAASDDDCDMSQEEIELSLRLMANDISK